MEPHATLVELLPLPRPVGTRRQTYQVIMAATGETLVDRARDPEHAAARALQAMGVVGKLLTRWPGSTAIAMRLDIQRAAGRTVDDQRLRIVPWSLRPAGANPTRSHHEVEPCTVAI